MSSLAIDTIAVPALPLEDLNTSWRLSSPANRSVVHDKAQITDFKAWTAATHQVFLPPKMVIKRQLGHVSFRNQLNQPPPVTKLHLPTTMPEDVTAANKGNFVMEELGKRRSGSAVMHRSLTRDPPQVVRAQGPYLFLKDGRKMLNATGGAAVSSLGHCDPRVRDAVMKQFDVIEYCHSMTYTTAATEELAQFLIDSTGGEMARVFICNSGSEAVEAALKLARQYHIENGAAKGERTRFIARNQSYHGITLGALDASGHTARRDFYTGILSHKTGHVSPCYEYRGLRKGETLGGYVARLTEELEQQFQALGPNNVAAFIAEPVVGAALGCVPAVKGYFKAVREVCNRHGALLIFDEIMCGSGRVGPRPSQRFPRPLHAWQDELIGVTPDIMTMAKGLGGGYQPIGAMLASEKVMTAIAHGSGAHAHGQTYQEHPIACAAALAVQKIVAEEDLIANVRRQGELLEKLLRAKLGRHAHVGDIRGRGLFWGIEFVADRETKAPFKAACKVAAGIQELGMQEPHNINLYPGSGTTDGVDGDHIILAPPYNIDEDVTTTIAEKTANVVKQYFEQMAERDSRVET